MSFVSAEFLPDFIDTQKTLFTLKDHDPDHEENRNVEQMIKRKVDDDGDYFDKKQSRGKFDTNPDNKYIIHPSIFRDYFGRSKIGVNRSARSIHELMRINFVKELNEDPIKKTDQLFGLINYMVINHESLQTDEYKRNISDIFKARRREDVVNYLTKVLLLTKKLSLDKEFLKVQNGFKQHVNIDLIFRNFKARFKLKVKEHEMKNLENKIETSNKILRDRQTQITNIEKELIDQKNLSRDRQIELLEKQKMGRTFP